MRQPQPSIRLAWLGLSVHEMKALWEDHSRAMVERDLVVVERTIREIIYWVGCMIFVLLSHSRSAFFCYLEVAYVGVMKHVNVLKEEKNVRLSVQDRWRCDDKTWL
jgi:hypothetical protein